jgi:hypothetical protein
VFKDRIFLFNLGIQHVSANQETIVELMNFFNTLFPSGQTQSSKADLGTITENEVTQDDIEQVGIALEFLSENGRFTFR